MDSNSELVEYLKNRGYIQSERVEEAFRNVDRKRFVPDSMSGRCYEDRPLRLEESSTISAPHMVAKNTELLEVQEESDVIEIGSGSGYQLAILSELTSGRVTGVEIDQSLVEYSREILSSGIEVLHGSGFGPVEGVFDRILYSCAIPDITRNVDRLRKDGIIVAPVEAGRGQVLKKYRDGEASYHGRLRFVSFQEQ